MGFANITELVDAELDGAVRYSTWRKTPSQTTGAGIWFDLSMSPGNPVPNYYASSPLNATVLRQSNDGGIFHGGNVSPATKHLRRLSALTLTAAAVPLRLMLLDYLLYYPFIDEGETAEQTLTNANTLPRYTDGDGVQMMAVVVAGQAGGQTFQVNYTNSAGVAGRTSQTVICNAQAVNGTIIHSNRAVALARGPFIPLQSGDLGVRSVQGVTMGGADVGLFSLVLVKPIADISVRGIDAPVEVDFFQDFGTAPRVVDDAYLNFISLPMGTLSAAPIHGDVTFVWSA